jgi:hypothetical protein
MSFCYMQAKQLGRKQKANSFNDVYDFGYKLKNAESLLEREEKISRHDKKKIWEFIELLRALRVSKGRIVKYILHLKKIGENLGEPFKKTDRKAIEHFVAHWLYSQDYSPETTSDYIMVPKRFYKFLRLGMTWTLHFRNAF